MLWCVWRVCPVRETYDLELRKTHCIIENCLVSLAELVKAVDLSSTDESLVRSNRTANIIHLF